jgi:serine/threonine protein kinase
LAILETCSTRDDASRQAPAIHGNITPWNIIVGLDGSVLLGGFGLAPLLELVPPADGKNDWFRWSAPEQFAHGQTQSAADIYALGALLWEAWTGRPFRFDAAQNSLSDESFSSEKGSERYRILSERLVPILRRALEPMTHRRFASVGKFRSELSSLLDLYTTGHEADELAIAARLAFPRSKYNVQHRLDQAEAVPEDESTLMDIDEALLHDEVTTKTDLSGLAMSLRSPAGEEGSSRTRALAVVLSLLFLMFMGYLWGTPSANASF